MYCKYCGKEVSDRASFCRHCGKELQPASRRAAERGSVDYESSSSEKEKSACHSQSSFSSRSGSGKYTRPKEKETPFRKVSRFIWRIVWIVLLICCASYTLNPDNNILGIHGMRKAYAAAQEVIQAELLSPSSAVFPEFEPEFVTQRTKIVTYEGKEYRVYTVAAYVDSHNAFGTLIRNEFVVEIGFPTEGDDDMYYYNILSLG